MPTLTSSLSTAPLKDVYQKELLHILDSYDGPKAVYWEREAMAPVNLIVGHSILKNHGVNYSFIIEPLKTSPTPPDSASVFYILRPELKLLDVIVKYLKSEFAKSHNAGKNYIIIGIPKVPLVCKSFLKETGVFDKLSGVYDLPLTLLPLDTDLLSMEDPNSFADFSLRDSETSLYNLAKGLMKFQSIYGLFPRIRSKGPKAKRVVEMLVQMRQEAMADTEGHGPLEAHPLVSLGQTDLLVIIDRSVDALTPCLSQLIFEGLINEAWPVSYGSMKLQASGSEQASSQKRVVFNSADVLFPEIRDQNFANVGTILSKRIKELSSVIEESRSAKKPSALRQVVNRLPELQQMYASAGLHLTIAEKVTEYATDDNFIASYRTQQDFLVGNESDKIHPHIEQRILQMAPLEEVLQLICVQSFCSGGLKPRTLEFYTREILQMYGSEHMMTLNNLRLLGLMEESSRLALAARPTNSSLDTLNFDPTTAVRHTIASVSLAYAGSLRRSLRLQVNTDSTGDEDRGVEAALSKIFGGTVPVSVRLVQAMSMGWPHVRSLISNTSLSVGRRLLSQASSAGASSTSSSYVTNLIPAVEVDEVQGTGDADDSSQRRGDDVIKSISVNAPGERTKTVVIAFVGGMTHSELAALRKVASYDGQVDFMFATTGMLTWKSFIGSLSEPIPVADLDE